MEKKNFNGNAQSTPHEKKIQKRGMMEKQSKIQQNRAEKREKRQEKKGQQKKEKHRNELNSPRHMSLTQ